MKVLCLMLIIISFFVLITSNVNAQNETVQKSIYSQIKNNSSKIQSSSFDNQTTINVNVLQTIESPFKQFKSGIAVKNISCNSGLVLIIKAEDGSPACVHPNSAENLLILGWATPIEISSNSVTVTGSNDIVNYNIIGGKLLGVVSITSGKEIYLVLNSTNNGVINITLPQSLINTNQQDQNDIFFISSSNHGRITAFNETDTSYNSTLAFPFKHGDSKIQIAVLSWLEKMGREHLRPET